MRYCPECGQEVEPADAFCFECGTELSGSGGDQIHSLRTVWASLVIAVLGIIESAMLLIMPGEIAQQAESFGFGSSFSDSLLMVMGGIGLVISLAVIGLCAYYYSEGYVDKRFFWGIFAAGAIGLLFAGGISFLILIAIGVFGLGVFLRR